MTLTDEARSPGQKLWMAAVVGFLLSIPLFVVWLLVYDRQKQSNEARTSITEGWGAPQTISGPVLAIPFQSEVEIGGGVGTNRTVTRRTIIRHLVLQPEVVRLSSLIDPEVRKRSIYEAVVYSATATGSARFAIPTDLSRYDLTVDRLDLAKAELRFGLSDPRGLGANPQIRFDGRALRLQPGNGPDDSGGFYAFVDATALATQPIGVEFDYAFRGNGDLSLKPQAGDTRWLVKSPWANPSFGGDFLPMKRNVTTDGFVADYPIGNLALGQPLVGIETPGPRSQEPTSYDRNGNERAAGTAIVSLIQPVDLYSRVDRAAKYGFLFIGFTFLALLMFDIVGGVRVSGVEYLLTGAALVLFFVLLLAFAEIIGFTPAYALASLAIAGLNTAYSAAVLRSWKRGAVMGGLLIGLYAVLYVLLGLEDLSLVIGSLLLFAALAGVMYLTSKIEWGETADQG